VNRRDVVWATAVALLTGALFLATLRPDVGGTEDSPKFQFLGQVLGTAHTPGYPFYTIATYVFTRVPLGTLAYRVNLFSAICGVFSCVLIFLIARRVSVSRSLAAVAALAAATGFPVWSNAITAEVYTLAALMSAWTIYLLIAWIQTRNEPVSPERPSGRGGGRLYAACIVFAAGLGNHLTIVGLLPAALLYGIARDRSVLRPRVLAIAAVIGAIGVAQYGFIALRTIQGAPYLEARATTIRGVYDVIIARDVSWARFYQAADKVVGIEVPMLLDGLRVHMGTVTVILVVIGIAIAAWRRNWEALLVAGGAAGTLAMIANLWGDVVGFITPVIVLLWTLAAYGLETIVRAIRPGDRAVNLVAAAALLLPVSNLFAVYPKLAPVLNPGDSPALRALYARLPPDSALVAHNYFIARILNYLHYSNEYDPDPNPRLLDNDAIRVRAAAAEGRQVFALEPAVPWLASQGLVFEPTALSEQPWELWLGRQRTGTTIAVATAGMLMPSASLPGQPPSDVGRPPNFGANVSTIGGAAEFQLSNTEASISRELIGRSLAITASDNGPTIKWGDDVLVAIDRGLAAVAISPSGRMIGRWTAALGEDPDVRVSPLAFVLRGDTPCEVLRTGQRVDVSNILQHGGWYATIDGHQIPAEISLTDAGSPSDWRLRLTNGRGTASIDQARRRLVLDGAPGTRAVFQFSLPPGLIAVHATLESNDHAVRVCRQPVPSLPATGALDIGPANDSFFSTGWHFAEDAGTQHFRWSQLTSTVRWQMDAPAELRFILPLRAAHANGATIRASLNGVELSSCALPAGAWSECRLEAPSSATRAGVNDLQLSSDTVAPDRPGDPRELAFVMQHGRVRVGK
jgi:hypothetical protein